MTHKPDSGDLAITLVSSMLLCDAARLRHVYSRIISHMEQISVPPTEVGAGGPGLPKEFRSFERLRKRVASADFNEIRNLSIRHLRPERNLDNYGFFDWTAHGGIGPEDALSRDAPISQPRYVYWSVFFEDVPIAEGELVLHLFELARQTVDNYGYIFYTPRRLVPPCYVVGLGVATRERTDDINSNVGGWAHYKARLTRTILRDVYAYNFLTRPYLNLPVEGMTLERWIETDSSRGTLERFTDHVILWKPLPANIPYIREALFRAGILFYWRFFDKFDPMYRDFDKRFVPPEPIPKMFRADFYDGRDPRITR